MVVEVVQHVFDIFVKYCENLDGKRKSTPPMSCAEDRLKEESFSYVLCLVRSSLKLFQIDLNRPQIGHRRTSASFLLSLIA